MIRIRAILFAAAVAASIIAAPAMAANYVTYTWTTISQGYGQHVDQPSSASFDVPLSDVLAGAIPQFDITNIQLSYPGLTFDSAVTSSGGLDFTAFVDPTTGAFIYHDVNQGLAVIAFASTDINTFLSITVDGVAYTASGTPLTYVADQFNALDSGSPYAGYPTSGYWTATFPTISAAPEPAIWAMLLIGFGGIGFLFRTSRRAAVTA